MRTFDLDIFASDGMQIGSDRFRKPIGSSFLAPSGNPSNQRLQRLLRSYISVACCSRTSSHLVFFDHFFLLSVP